MDRHMREIRDHVEQAHEHIQAAQEIAYRNGLGAPLLRRDCVAPLRVRLALNRAQSVLIKLLVHRLREET